MDPSINSKFWRVAGVVIAFCALIVALFQLYIHRDKQTALEIKKINVTELTRPLNVAKLSSTYLYDSIPVEHLWQTSYVIKNIGETALYGEGFENKNICGSAIKLHITNSDKLLSIAITDSNSDAVLENDSSLKFIQWRPGEYIELLLLSDGPEAPEVTINDREIQNATITNVMYSPEEQLVPKRLVDRWPKGLKSTLWWVTIVVESLSFVLIVCTFVYAIIKDKRNKEDCTSDVSICIWLVFLILLPIIWMF